MASDDGEIKVDDDHVPTIFEFLGMSQRGREVGSAGMKQRLTEAVCLLCVCCSVLCPDAPDMIPLCSGGGAYSHVFGSCLREAREWEDRKRSFHKWRKVWMHQETMGRSQNTNTAKVAAASSKDDAEAAAHDLGEMEESEEEEGKDSDGDGDVDEDDRKKDDDDDHVWTFKKSGDDHDDHDDL